MRAVRVYVSRIAVHAVLAAGLLYLGCTSGANVQPVRAQEAVSAPDAFDHSALTRLLRQHVDDTGMVDYAAIQAQRDAVLTPYLQRLAETDPSNLDEAERLAFWINAYNALTIKLIIDHYPVESIKDITPLPGPAVPKVNTPWQLDVGEVGGQMRTLDEIEHEIIRERFDEPRIHFALVCAAVSCPRLRQEAYTGAALDRQLDDQARTFLHDASKNRVPAGAASIAISSIFKWFQEDFGDDTAAVQQYLATYFDGTTRRKLQEAAYEVDYLDYDWSLNDQARAGASASSRE